MSVSSEIEQENELCLGELEGAVLTYETGDGDVVKVEFDE